MSLLWYFFVVDGDAVDFREYYVPATSFISFRLAGYVDDCCCLSIWFAMYWFWLRLGMPKRLEPVLRTVSGWLARRFKSSPDFPGDC